MKTNVSNEVNPKNLARYQTWKYVVIHNNKKECYF